MTHDYDIVGMHCGSCVAKIGAALRGLPDVTEAEVTLQPPRARVTMSRHVPDERLRQAVSDAGDYRIEPAAQAEPTAATSGTAGPAAEESPPESLYPLLLIVGYLLGAVLLIEWSAGGFDWARAMRHFMAGFFIVFSFFKLLDPPGFVTAYRGYDLLARRSKAWAWGYPYVELGLGVAYLLNLWPVAVNLITLVVMAVGAAGVLRALLDKRAIRCACLGTALNLPMTKVTLIEDLTMAAMAAVMLLAHLI